MSSDIRNYIFNCCLFAKRTTTQVGVFIGIICVSLNMMVGFYERQLQTHEEKAGYYCFTTIYIQYVISVFMCVVPFCTYFRYVVLMNISIQQAKVINNNTSSPWQLKLLNQLVRPSFNILIAAMTAIGWYVLSIIVNLIFGWNCDTFGPTLMRYITLAWILLVVASVVLVMAFDCWQNRNLLIKCQIYKFLIQNDHYYYRLEFFLVPIILPCAIIRIFVPLPSMISSIFMEILFLTALWASGFFALIMTTYLFLKRLCKPKSSQKRMSELEHTFQEHGLLYGLFYEFCALEFSLENAHFKNRCIEYKKSTLFKKMEIMEDIDKAFFRSDSPFQLNVQQKQITEVMHKIEDVHYTFPDDLLDILERQVNINLSDTYARFMYTIEYEAYQTKIQIAHDVSK